MPAYNAERTLRETYRQVVAQAIVDIIVIVDDCSVDSTRDHAEAIVRENSHNPWKTIYHRHSTNLGYGGNQKTCYRLALDQKADVVVMVHPDCQYTPKLLVPMAAMIVEGLHPCVLASRILGGSALKGGMPLWKYVCNRGLTAVMNVLFGSKLSEFHTGYRAFSAELLAVLPLDGNVNDFVFDAEMLAEILWTGATIGEVSCPTVYSPEVSSIGFLRSVKYGIGCLRTACRFRLARWGIFASFFAILQE